MMDHSPTSAAPEQRGDTATQTAEAARAARLDAMGQSLAKKRSEAIHARQQSGIETQWAEDEEFYQGIDDQNRNEHSNAWRTKPPGQYTQQAVSGPRSTVFLNITAPYCDIAAARFADMVIPTDEANFKIEPTPVPELLGLSKGKLPARLMAQVKKTPGSEALVAKAVEQAVAIIGEATDKAKKAQLRIEDWHVEGQWHAEVRRVIEDSARIGSGVLKGPVPVKRKGIAFIDNALVVEEKTCPGSKRIDAWNFFPAGSCGDNIHNGSGTWERDYLTDKQLIDLIGSPGYIESQIRLCLEEGPHKAIAPTKAGEMMNYSVESEDKRYEIWYFHGQADREDMLAAGCECEDGDFPQIPAVVSMVNDRVIKGALNPLDTGDVPYDVFPWRRKPGMPWGDGIARQIRTAQRIVNAGVRTMMDNAGLSGGPQIVVKQGAITPADGKWELTPRKIWYWAEDADTDDIRKVMQFFEIPSKQAELMGIVQFGLKIAEDVTGLPMLLQGQQGKAPDTVGGMTMLNNNASAGTRRIARTFDDCVTEPHVRREYAWLLQYGEDDDEKGDFSINAIGSASLIERDQQSQALTQVLPMSLNPVYGKDPKKAADQWLKALRFDPKQFDYDDEEWRKVVTNMTQHQDPRVAVAQLRAQTEEKLKQLEQQFEQAENDKDRRVKIALGMIDERMSSVELSAVERQTLEKLKVELAKTTITVAAQERLAGMDVAHQKDLALSRHIVDLHKNSAPQVARPVAEPPGRAPNGRAFQA